MAQTLFTLMLMLAVVAVAQEIQGDDVFLGGLSAESAENLVSQGQMLLLESDLESRLAAKQQRLTQLSQVIQQQRNHVDELTARLANTGSPVEQERLTTAIRAANKNLVKLKKTLEELAVGGVDLSSLTGSGLDETVGFESSMQKVFEPLLVNLRRVTERPRQIERFKSEIDYYESRLPELTAGINRIVVLKQRDIPPELKASLSTMEERWRRKKSLFENRLQATLVQLEESTGDASVFSGAGKTVMDFLQGRGLSILLAILAFIVALLAAQLLAWLFRRIHGDSDSSQRYYGQRLLALLGRILSILLAVVAAMAVLSARNDWLVLGILLLLLFGIVWSLKNTLPELIDEVKLMLNMGVVREGERVVFNGVPWKVRKIGMYTDLQNPLLTGGEIRITLNDLGKLHARQYDPKEDWFPTKEGDYVLLDDDNFARVVYQSPEYVKIKVLGASIRTIRTPDFIGLNLTNISQAGFGLFLDFKVAADHVAHATSAIPEQLQASIKEAIKQEFWAPHVQHFQVEYRKAEIGYLVLMIIAIFDGKSASAYFKIRRALRRLALDAALKNGWDIPYSKINIEHKAAD